MAGLRMAIALGILVVAHAAAGQPASGPPVPPAPPASPATPGPPGSPGSIDQLEKALPPGWSLLATGSELVFRHDRPCYVTGAHHPNAPLVEHRTPAPAGGGPLVTIELRYRLEPKWTDAQVTAAKATNEKIGAELRALAARYHIDTIHHSKGRPLPANADERARLAAHDAAHARLAAKIVKLPRCSLGDTSVFDGEDTYAQLSLEIDPPEVIPQAHRIIALMKEHCG